MKPRIRKKGLNADGTNNYVLEWIERNTIKVRTLNPNKLIKMFKNEKVDVSISTHKPMRENGH